jgi:hypothetical protein
MTTTRNPTSTIGERAINGSIAPPNRMAFKEKPNYVKRWGGVIGGLGTAAVVAIVGIPSLVGAVGSSVTEHQDLARFDTPGMATKFTPAEWRAKGDREYTVQEGDNPTSIAQTMTAMPTESNMFDATQEIEAQTGNNPQPGQEVVLPLVVV